MAGIDKGMDHAASLIRAAAKDGALEAAEFLRGEAIDLAPKEEGTLRNSAKADVEQSGAETKLAVSFDTPYAVRQHEELSYHHKQGQAKYLETAVTANKDKALDHIAERVRRAL